MELKGKKSKPKVVETSIDDPRDETEKVVETKKVPKEVRIDPPKLNPDNIVDLKDIPGLFHTIHQMLSSLVNLNCEYELRLPDGQLFWLVPTYSEKRERNEISFQDAATMTVVCAAFGGTVESMRFVGRENHKEKTPVVIEVQEVIAEIHADIHDEEVLMSPVQQDDFKEGEEYGEIEDDYVGNLLPEVKVEKEIKAEKEVAQEVAKEVEEEVEEDAPESKIVEVKPTVVENVASKQAKGKKVGSEDGVLFPPFPPLR